MIYKAQYAPLLFTHCPFFAKTSLFKNVNHGHHYHGYQQLHTSIPLLHHHHASATQYLQGPHPLGPLSTSQLGNRERFRIIFRSHYLSSRLLPAPRCSFPSPSLLYSIPPSPLDRPFVPNISPRSYWSHPPARPSPSSTPRWPS